MRSTIHLVTADDALTLRPLVHEVLARELRQKMFAPHLDGLDLVPVLAAGRAALEERPMTASELGRVLAERWPDRSPAALSHAVRCLVPLVQVPSRGLWGRSGRSLHAPTDSWLGRPVDPAPSLDAMLLRYLAAFGPATVADMRTWSGLTGLGSAVDRLRPQLKTFRDDRGRELLDLPDAPRPDADTPAPPRFLPEYDNVLLNDDRSRIVSQEARARMAGRYAVLVDGVVGGTWRIETERDKAVLDVELFSPAADAVEAEASTLLGLLAPERERVLVLRDGPRRPRR